MKKLLLVLTLILLWLQSECQVIFETPLSDRLTGYDINADLNPARHMVTADMKAYWVNPSEHPVSEVMMHMYLNAFSSNKSSYAIEGRGGPSGKEGSGWIRILTISDGAGNDLSKVMKYVSPDDGNQDDRTVLRIDLPEPVKPHDTLWLKVRFESKLPNLTSRTGYNQDFYFVGQWFPKFGVYETAGTRQRVADGWNCHQFHANSEFYANHSVYNVSVTMPDEYVAGSGGITVEEIENSDSTKKVVWHAEDIVDFAWTAWPGYKVVKDKWRGVDITLLTTTEALKNSGRQIQALKNSLEYLDANVGLYPWPHVTFVDPPSIGAACGGMEYTTLFTSEPSALFPNAFKMVYMVTMHEFDHAYFMGILASNEFEEPWLDEGVNSYWESRVVDNYYGEGYGLIRLPFMKFSDYDYQRVTYVVTSSKRVATNDMFSWQYPHGTYGMMSYNKAAIWLSSLEGIIGTETMNDVFKEYYRRWAFRHPSGKDFIDVVNDVVKKEYGNKFGDNMNWYFDQVLYGNGICDYKLVDISNRKITGFSGIVEGDSVSYIKSDRKADTLNKAMVRLERLGDITIPVKVAIGFDNGDQVIEEWDGKAWYKDFTYEGMRKVTWAKIDPDYKNPMDVNLINNSYGIEPNHVASGRMMTKFIALMQLLISFITI